MNEPFSLSWVIDGIIGQCCGRKDLPIGTIRFLRKLLKKKLAPHEQAIAAAWPLFDKHGPVTGSRAWHAAWASADMALRAAIEDAKPHPNAMEER